MIQKRLETKRFSLRKQETPYKNQDSNGALSKALLLGE